MLKRKLIGWVAAGVLAGAPAIGMARTHHVTAAAAPSSVLTQSSAAKPVAATKLISHKKKATKARRSAKKKAAKHRATKTRHTVRNATRKTKKAYSSCYQTNEKRNPGENRGFSVDSESFGWLY
jgi:hypothetical protein